MVNCARWRTAVSLFLEKSQLLVDDIGIGISRTNGAHYSYPIHSHDHMELAVIVSGCGTHVVDDQEYPVVAGDVFVFQGKHTHGFKDVENLDMFNIHVRSSNVVPFLDELNKLPGYHALFTFEPKYRYRHNFESRLRLSGEQLEFIMRMLERMHAEFVEGGPGGKALVVTMFVQIAIYLSRYYSKTKCPVSSSLLQLGEVISTLEHRYAEMISLEELAVIANMSVTNLLRVFKLATGTTPIEYLLRVRTKRAMQLLQESDISITKIALSVGFSNSGYFTKQFKRIVGVTPREYRQTLSTLVDLNSVGLQSSASFQ